MSESIVIKYGGRQYWARRIFTEDNPPRRVNCGPDLARRGGLPSVKSLQSVSIGVAFLKPVHHQRHVIMPDEESARRWLSDNGLRKSKAKKLLSAALRNEGDYADPLHPHRVREPRMDTDLPREIQPQDVGHAHNVISRGKLL